jgi:hypothetical protein
MLGADDFRLSWSNRLHVEMAAISPPIAAGISTKVHPTLGKKLETKAQSRSKPRRRIGWSSQKLSCCLLCLS